MPPKPAISRRLSLAPLLCALAVFAVASAAKSEGTESKWFTTPGHAGALVLEVPANWSHRTQTAGGRPTNVKMQTSGPELNFTLMWNAGNSPEFNSPEQLSAGLEAAPAPYKAEDADFEVEKLSGPHVAGLYTTLQNPDLVDVTELGPDQYRVLTPGILAVGELQVFFSMISKEKDSEDRLLALEMFRGARFEADASSRVDNRISVPVTVEDGLLSPSHEPDEHDSDGHSH